MQEIFEKIGGAFPTVPESAAQGQRTVFSEKMPKDCGPLKAQKNTDAGTSIYKADTVTPSIKEAFLEAEQCWNCGCLAVSPSDLGGALLALGGRVITTKRSIPADGLFKAGVLRSTVLDHDELILEIVIPPQQDGAVQCYRKYRARNSVDFPIVSLSSVISVSGGMITAAKLVLGACAPEPMRLFEVERMLLGREPSEELSLKAAALVREKGLPLSENAYKLRIAAAYVRRTVMQLTGPDGPDAI